jgi:hypothetical protein
MRRALVALWAGVLATLVAGLVGCEGGGGRPMVAAAPPCPAPIESDKQVVVVGTIGKLHMAEAKYPLAKLGDVMSAFKPDLVLLGVRPDPFREGNYEDASFEMTYLAALAKNRAIPAEGIDWFREQDLAAPLPPIDPPTEAENARKGAEILARPKLYPFEQANGAELTEAIYLATASEQRYRSGNPLWSRRAAFIGHLAVDATIKHKKPKKVLAFVDVFDRPTVMLALGAVGYESRDPVVVSKQANEQMMSDLPPEVLSQYKNQLGRVREKIEKAKGPDKAFWQEREKILEVVVDKRAACCVPTTALGVK